MRCLVTGVTGFVGSNLAMALVDQGHTVRGLVRKGADTRALEGLDFEPMEGDLTDGRSVRAAAKGCEWCFHVAASYHLWLRDYGPMYRANVEGTRNVLRAAGDAGCSRIIHTSTVGCIGLPRDQGPDTQPTDETAIVSEDQMANPYKRSKWQAEEVALELVREKFPVVIVNPTAPIGPRDVKPTPTGKVVVDFLNRELPGYVDTGLNWVHVRDVALGHILAAERGRVGERYILGHAEGNWTMRQTLEVLAELTGLRAPRLRVPYAVAYGTACVSEFSASITGRAPRAPLAGVKMARHKMWFSPAKAIRELGLPQTPPKEAFRDAVEWFREHGYVQR